MLAISIGNLILKLVDFQHFVHSYVKIFKQMADFLYARLLLSIDLVTFGLPTTELTSSTFEMKMPIITLLTYYTIAVKNVSATYFITNLTKILRNFVFWFLHQYSNIKIILFFSQIYSKK